MKLTLFLFSTLLTPIYVQASNLDGSQLSLLWSVPFACVLLSIALMPLFLHKIWERHFGKITALWTVLLLIPLAITFNIHTVIEVVGVAILEEYIPFILLLFALYTISGGILVWGELPAGVKTNTSLLAIGTLLASIMGTTGAAMLMIRPLLRANQSRKHKIHVVVFFILLVANIGGGLTPLGDPPLFLGFLKGVDFMWTVEHMILPVFISVGILLTIFYCIDSYFFRQPDEIDIDKEFGEKKDKLNIFGRWNLLLLLGVVAIIIFSGTYNSGIEISILGVEITLESLIRDGVLLSLAIISLIITPKQVRAGNEFSWEPMLEVGKLFLGIFITITPVIAILQAGENGHMKPLLDLAHASNGEPINSIYFWMTGLLSAFLDNAPTYLVFFNMASGNAEYLMTEAPRTLLAVSMGSVFMGALSYIGNAPNFMVKSIAEQRGVKMPSFFAYMAWSFGILIPLFILLTWIFF